MNRLQRAAVFCWRAIKIEAFLLYLTPTFPASVFVISGILGILACFLFFVRVMTWKPLLLSFTIGGFTGILLLFVGAIVFFARNIIPEKT